MMIEKLMEKPYWIIDIFPKQVPRDSTGQYFAIEDFFLKELLSEIKKKHINVILKLNCYRDITIDDEKNPAPEQIRDTIFDEVVLSSSFTEYGGKDGKEIKFYPADMSPGCTNQACRSMMYGKND